MSGYIILSAVLAFVAGYLVGDYRNKNKTPSINGVRDVSDKRNV